MMRHLKLERPPLKFGQAPIFINTFKFDLPEVMYYLYLPVIMGVEHNRVCLPMNIGCIYQMLTVAQNYAIDNYGWRSRYVYVSARKGWATKDNPLNRPGWHVDGFGTRDLNFVWWTGAGTRFAIQAFNDISTDHKKSLQQFEEQVDPKKVGSYPEKGLFLLDQGVVHATPDVDVPHMRQYVKISMSDERYNLENNSHNYEFKYNWPMHGREEVRNDTSAAQKDYK